MSTHLKNAGLLAIIALGLVLTVAWGGFLAFWLGRMVLNCFS